MYEVSYDDIVIMQCFLKISFVFSDVITNSQSKKQPPPVIKFGCVSCWSLSCHKFFELSYVANDGPLQKQLNSPPLQHIVDFAPATCMIGSM
jgi:hypothetical protein